MIPEIELDRLLGWVELPCEDGALPDAEARVLLEIVRAERPRIVLEIGTYMGATTRRLAEMVHKWNGVVVTVDLPVGMVEAVGMEWSDPHLIARRDVGREFRGQRCAEWIIQILCDTRKWDWAEARGAELIFIDGSHTYEYVKHDSEMAKDETWNGGTIVWHDCDDGHPGVTRLLGEWRAAGRDVQRIAGTRLAYWRKYANS